LVLITSATFQHTPNHVLYQQKINQSLSKHASLYSKMM
jgi:hypothetical protein